jgi:hypothetical protein
MSWCAGVESAHLLFLTPEALLYSPSVWVEKNILDIFEFKITRCMKTLHIDSFQMLSSEELIAVRGGATGLSSLNPTITGLFSDLTLTTAVTLAAVSKTITDLTGNLDSATGSGGLLGGGLLGGSGSGLLGGGINL